MELTVVVAVKGIWQLQPSLLHPCKVCDQGRNVGKIRFIQNRKMVGVESSPRTHTGAFWGNLKRCFGSWNCGETFENKDASWWFLVVFETTVLKLELLRNFLKRCRLIVHSAAIWNDVLEVETAEKIFTGHLPKREV